MELVKLKNGSEGAEGLVNVTLVALDGLMRSNPKALYDLVKKCRNKDYKFLGNNEKVLEEMALLNGGKPHNSIKNIVLSAIKGESLDMRIVSPIK